MKRRQPKPPRKVEAMKPEEESKALHSWLVRYAPKQPEASGRVLLGMFGLGDASVKP